jgi:hypothetical protein
MESHTSNMITLPGKRKPFVAEEGLMKTTVDVGAAAPATGLVVYTVVAA